jgi:hypothetical protein
MILIFVIIGGIFIFILFNQDKKQVERNVEKRGGLKKIYPNFMKYVEQSNSGELFHDLTLDETRFEEVKDDIEYLEFKIPVKSFNGDFLGYYHIGIQHTFGSFAYCYCINSYGRRIDGFISELHNGRNNSIKRDKEPERYKEIFLILIRDMENSSNFDDKFQYNIFR